MATRSNIGYRDNTGTYHYIYCHWDGYPTGVGRTLINHYKDYESVADLISRGDMSALGARCDGDIDHSFDSPSESQTVYYQRDRGEEGCEPRTTKDRMETYENEYSYIFEDGQWFCIGHMGENWMPVYKAILIEEGS